MGGRLSALHTFCLDLWHTLGGVWRAGGIRTPNLLIRRSGSDEGR